METQQLRYRMYGLVPYNLSPIQQGIQFGHAVVQYALHYFAREPFQDWAWIDKTFIILNGGTTNNIKDGDGIYKGSLNKHLVELEKNNIVVSTFHEPDINDALTAVVFLVDERVWDKEKYPDYYPFSMLNTIVPDPHYDQWVDRIGGEKNVFLRNFLKQFKLA